MMHNSSEENNLRYMARVWLQITFTSYLNKYEHTFSFKDYRKTNKFYCYGNEKNGVVYIILNSDRFDLFQMWNVLLFKMFNDLKYMKVVKYQDKKQSENLLTYWW